MAESKLAENIPSSSVLRSSEWDFDIVCQPCGHDGKNVEADGFCLDCCEYLCSTCYRYHNKLAITRHHKLADKENMPKQPGSVKVKDVCVERCRSHEDEIVKYFCPTHEKLGCSVCVTIKHKLCDVKYIADVCKNLENKKNYKTFQTRLKNLILKSEKLIWSGTRALEELQALSRDCDTMIEQKRYCQMFTEIKQAERRLTEIRDTLGGVEVDRMRDLNLFDEKIHSVKENQDNFCTVVERPLSDIKLTRKADVRVKSRTDSKLCWITGVAVMSKEKLIATDNQNIKINLCGTITETVISELIPEKKPWDVTRVSENVAAVTLPEAQKILILTCDKKLVIDREISVKGKCYGVDCSYYKLFVSYTCPSKVEILSMSGEVLQTFFTNVQGQELFSCPRYIFVNTNNQSIYVSDSGKHSVIQIDMDGNIIRVYDHSKMHEPTKITVDALGLLYIGCSNCYVHLVTPELCLVKVILVLDDVEPWGIGYCDATKKLYIGMRDENCALVFKVKIPCVYKVVQIFKNAD